MKRDMKPDNIIRQELDAELSFLDSRPSLHYDIMSEIKGEKAVKHCAPLTSDPYLMQWVLHAEDEESRKKGEIVVKRKMPVAFVLAIVLMLSGLVAVAATLLWQDYVPQMKQTEQEMGDYVEWPATRRIQLAKDITAMGYLDESEDTQILSSETASEEDKAAAADRLMLKLTGLEDVKEIHSTLITYAIMGHEDTWTPEQRVWWNGIVTMYGDDGAADTLVVPTQEDVTEQDAVAIAKAAIQDAYGFDDEYMNSLHPIANLYTTDERPNYKRWDIQFKKYREGSSRYVEKIYSAVVDEKGEVISDPNVGILHPAEKVTDRTKPTSVEVAVDPMISDVYDQYGRQAGGRNIWTLSLEEKAFMLGGVNRIPNEGSISETDATRIARERMNSIGYDMSPFEVSVWYIVDDVNLEKDSSDTEVFVVYFIDNIDNPVSAYLVTVGAKTGTVVDTYTPGPLN